MQRPSDSLNALYAVDAESGATARYMTFDMRTFDMNHFQVLEGGYAIINGRVTGSFRKVDSLRRQRRSAAARRSARFARAARPFCAPRVAAGSCGARAHFSPASESPAVFSLRPLTCSQKKVLLAKTRNLLCPVPRRTGQGPGEARYLPCTLGGLRGRVI